MAPLKWHLSNNQPGRGDVASPNATRGKNIPGTEHSQCKGPELSTCLVCQENREGPEYLQRTKQELREKSVRKAMWRHAKQNLKR